jgi:transcriptional/translational regulatory protein YebC/TACO1
VKVEGREAERCLALMEKLEEHDDVQGVFSNADIDAEQLERAAAG